MTRLVSQSYLADLRSAGVSYLVCGGKQLNLVLALDKLRSRFGIRRLMLQGGGAFNGAMLQAGLVDEFSQVVVPIVDGGRGVTSVFEMPGSRIKKAAASLKTIKHRVLHGGVQWHRYRVLNRL